MCFFKKGICSGTCDELLGVCVLLAVGAAELDIAPDLVETSP